MNLNPSVSNLEIFTSVMVGFLISTISVGLISLLSELLSDNKNKAVDKIATAIYDFLDDYVHIVWFVVWLIIAAIFIMT